jgi:hypothetical protein
MRSFQRNLYFVGNYIVTDFFKKYKGQALISMRKIDPGFFRRHPMERAKEIGDVVLSIRTVVREDDLRVLGFQILPDRFGPGIGLPKGRGKEQ